MRICKKEKCSHGKGNICCLDCSKRNNCTPRCTMFAEENKCKNEEIIEKA